MHRDVTGFLWAHWWSSPSLSGTISFQPSHGWRAVAPQMWHPVCRPARPLPLRVWRVSRKIPIYKKNAQTNEVKEKCACRQQCHHGNQKEGYGRTNKSSFYSAFMKAPLSPEVYTERMQESQRCGDLLCWGQIQWQALWNLYGITALQITHTVTESFTDLFKHTPCRNSKSYKLLPISLCSPFLKTFQINESEAKVTQSLLGCLPSKQCCQERRAALAGVKSASEEQWS